MISLGGDWFLLVALFGLVLQLTGSAVAVAFVLAAQDLTYFLVSPAAGLLADRLDRRRLMVVADLARATLCLGFLLVRGTATVWLTYPLLATMATFSAAFEPASLAALPNLVEDRDLATANALSGSLWGTMLAVGAALGGIVTAAFGRDAAIVIDAVSFLLSAWLIVRIHRPFALAHVEDHTGVRAATTETVHYARRDHRVLALLAVKFGWGLAGGVLVLIPVFAQQRLPRRRCRDRLADGGARRRSPDRAVRGTRAGWARRIAGCSARSGSRWRSSVWATRSSVSCRGCCWPPPP